MPINFVAIDFETANSDRGSACALGIAVVQNGVITSRKYSLLNPHVSFEPFSTHIHGITTETVQRAPDFAEIYPMVYEMLNGNTVAAHNTDFDIAVLNAVCRNRRLSVPRIHPFDSVEMAQKAWPNLEKYKLNMLAQHFQIPLKHHNAVEDATVCALLILRACKEYQAESLSSLWQILDGRKKGASKSGETAITSSSPTSSILPNAK